MIIIKEHICDFTLDTLKYKLKLLNEQPYRAEQLFSWVYKKLVFDFSKMTGLPDSLRKMLTLKYDSALPVIENVLKSNDGSVKYLFNLRDSAQIESVVIKHAERRTLCLSTQVGCKFGCAFCASGLVKFKRNLLPNEILGQLLYAMQAYKGNIDNFVFMGMGEPLDNLDNLLKVIEIMTDPKALAISVRRITVSTSGLAPAIERMAALGVKVNLALSLHATENKKRDELIPLNRRYNIERLIDSCAKYSQSSGRMATIEYVLIKDVNDTPEDAARLAVIAHKMHAKVNLIAYNKMPEFKFHSTSEISAKYFQYRLMNKKVQSSLRKSAGKDISGACGQLAYKGKESKIENRNLISKPGISKESKRPIANFGIKTERWINKKSRVDKAKQFK